MTPAPSAEEYLKAAAEVPAGLLSDAARDHLRALRAAGHAQAGHLLARDDAARIAAAGPLPRVPPFTPEDIQDAYRRHQQGTWPRLPPAPLYRLVTHELFRDVLRALALSDEAAVVTLGHLRAYRSDAPGGYEYAHPDRPALTAALTTLHSALWAALKRQREEPRP